MPYREGGQGGMQLAPDTRRRTMLFQIAGGLIAGAALLGTYQYVTRPQPAPQLAGTQWKGEIGDHYGFTLSIDTVQDGLVEGRMEWPGWGTTKVHGTVQGKHLLLIYYAIVSGGVPLGDRKDLTIDGDEMHGTDKDGAMKLNAKRVTP